MSARRILGSVPASVSWLLPTNVFLFVFLSLTQAKFFTSANMTAVLSALGLTIAISLGQMVVIASGGMNLSLGATGAMAGLATCYLLAHTSLPLCASIFLGLLVGAITGWINGVIIGRFGLSAFIVTLATASVYTGIALGLTQAEPIGGLPSGFIALGAQGIAGIPYVFILALTSAVLVALLMSRSAFGRQVLALGGNPNASQLVGMRRSRVICGAHVVSALLAAWAGILAMAQLGQGQPQVGSDWLLGSFAAPIIGGTLFSGGYLSVFGTCLGGLLLTIVSSGAVFLNVSASWVQCLQGAVVVGAAVLERARLGHRGFRLRLAPRALQVRAKAAT